MTALDGRGSGDIGFSALESSITDYMEKYAEENHFSEDDTYNEKLRETIDNGEKIISDATDLLRTETLQKSGYLSKLHKLRTLTFAGVGVCGARCGARFDPRHDPGGPSSYPPRRGIHRPRN